MKKIWLLFFFGFLYRIAIGLQGVDAVDAGFCNTFYQVIFQNPDSNVFCFIYYLLGVVGGIWEILFGTFGLIGFRVLEALTLTGAIALLYITFSTLIPRIYLTAAVIVAFLYPTIVVTFHYDTFSYLLIAASAWCFKCYITEQQTRWLMGVGAMIGLAFFVRIVNGTLFLLLLAPLLWQLYQRGGWSRAVFHAMVMTGGLLLGVGSVIALMWSLGHIPYYLDALGEAFSTFSGSEATHSHGHLVSQYFKGTKNLLLQVIAILSIWQVFQYSWHLASLRRHVLQVILIMTFLLLAYTSPPHLSLLAICVIVLVTALRRRHRIKLVASDTDGIPSLLPVCLYLAVATLLFPFGSDIGIQGIFHWCVGLLVFPCAWCAYRLSIRHLKEALLVATCCIAAVTLVRTAIYVYGEENARWDCVHQVQSSRLNVMVSSHKADVYRRAIAAINEHIGTQRLLFSTNQAAELYYATHSLPFEGHVQPVIYTGERLFWRLDERLAHFGNYPLILFLTTQEDTSPETPDVQRDTRLWMQLHHYQKVYDDGDTQLFAPSIQH